MEFIELAKDVLLIKNAVKDPQKLYDILKKSKTVIHKKGKKYDSYCSGKMKDNWFPTYMTKTSVFECISSLKHNHQDTLLLLQRTFRWVQFFLQQLNDI